MAHWCRECKNAYERANWAKKTTEDPDYSHRKKRKSKYDLSDDQYLAMVERQGGRCGICLAKPERLFVDHNHRTGKVRGLLCRGCNFGLGQFRDSLLFLQAAGTYLNRTDDEANERLQQTYLALLSLFAVVNDVFEEHDSFDPDKIKASLGRVYREWKVCRSFMETGFDPEKYSYERKKKPRATGLVGPGNRTRSMARKRISETNPKRSEKNGKPKQRRSVKGVR